jgi:DnaJ family protein C protein 19
MGEILLGAAALVIFLMFLYGFTKSDARILARYLRYLGAALAAAFAAALLFEGRFGFAFIVGSFAWSLFTGGHVWPGGPPHYGNQPRSGATHMTRAEALDVLGLKEGASKDEIREAYRRAMMQNHPDRGGSNYLSAKINEAKDVLLGD